MHLNETISSNSEVVNTIRIPSYLPQYYRAISGLNGLMFLMLALAVLNYGSRLETMISHTKPKSPNNNFSQDNMDNKKAPPKRLPADTSYELMALNDTSRKVLHGLDLRIFIITICLSMLFFVVSVSEFLTAWAVIEKATDKWKVLMVSLLLVLYSV
jgi:hypothetical protein